MRISTPTQGLARGGLGKARDEGALRNYDLNLAQSAVLPLDAQAFSGEHRADEYSRGLIEVPPELMVPTTLVAGDIAIVAVRALGPDPGPGVGQDPDINADSFAFVLLRAIGSGTVINFTDAEWVGGAGGGFNTEGVIVWTAPSDLAAGTVVTVSFNGATAGNMSIATQAGDQIFAYQGTHAAPTILAGLQTMGPFAGSGMGNGSVSELPPQLTLGTTALTFPSLMSSDNDAFTTWAYSGPVSGSRADLLAAIHSVGNWTGGDDYEDVTIPGTFNVGAPAAPTEMALRGNGIDIVDGDTSASYDDHTQFGQTAVSAGTIDRVYTILNQGGTTLNLGAISITGAAASDFTVVGSPSATVAPGGSTTVTLRFDPSAAGLRTASIAIANDDSNENPYNFVVSGSGSIAGTALVAGDIAIVGFNATFGNTQFAFVLLKAVVAGTVIRFTDAGWTGSALNAGESVVQWVAPSDLPFGTVVQFD